MTYQSNRDRALVFWLLAVLSFFSLLSPAPAHAEGTGVIHGRLANGTAGGGSPSGAEVVLHVFRGGMPFEDRPSRSDGAGSFAFDGLETGEGHTYQITASYAGVPYVSGTIRFDAGERQKEIDLTVYETADADPGLRVRRATVVLVGVDVGSQTLQALEMVTLENPSDRTFVPTQSGPAGPMGLLRFALPPHAGDLRPGPGLEGFEIIAVDRGFATSAPVPPGATEFFFTYRFPYQPGRSRFMRSVPYSTAELQVFAPEGGPSVAGADLQAAEALQIGAGLYRRYVARDLPTGQPLELVLGDLPGRWPWNLPVDRVPAVGWVALGLGVSLSLAAGAAWRLRRSAAADGARPERLGPLGEIAALDEAFASGELADAAYREQREEAKARALELFRAQRPGS